MPSASIRSFLALGFLLSAGLSLSPAPLRAQTLDSGVGVAPSQKLSTPPNADPINQPGAMRRAYSHPARKMHKPPVAAAPAPQQTPPPR